MSSGRKKDRYNETWTKEELTESLRRNDSKSSSHRSKSGKKSSSRRKANDQDYQYEERDKDKSRSRREDDERRRQDRPDEKTERRSRREDEDYDRKDRHRDKNREERRHRERDIVDTEENDRRHKSSRSKVDRNYEKLNRDEKRSSRHHKTRSDSHEDREMQEYESSRRDRHKEKDRHRNDDQERRRRLNQDDIDESELKRRHKSKYDDMEERDKSERKHRSSKHQEERKDDKAKHSDEDMYGYSRKRGEKQKPDEHDEEYRRKRRERKDRDDEHRGRREDDEKRERHEKREKEERRRGEDDEKRDKRKKRKRENEREDEHRQKKEDDEKRERHKKRERESEKTSHSTSSSSTRRDQHKKTDSNSNLPVENNDYDNDEFEDYEDDFEDSDSGANSPDQQKAPRNDMDDLMMALKSENERANSAQSSSRARSYPPSDGNETPYSQSSDYSRDQSRNNSGRSAAGPVTMINFSVGSKSMNSQTQKKLLKRSTDLMSLIQLESAGFDILDMPPVTEYNLYIKNYGNSDRTQASVQCNEDNLDQDIQTDVPNTATIWTQHPPHDLKCSGGADVVSDYNETDGDIQSVLSTLRVDTLRVTKFMRRATKLVEAILNEDETWKSSKKRTKDKSELSFCESVTTLKTNLAYLQGRRVVHIASSQGSLRNVIAVAFESASHSFSTRIDRKGLIAIWDTRKPTIPEKILVCDAQPTYCCFGVGKSYILFTGTDDGCVLAYDLRENGVYHQIVSLEPTRETILRSATYTTGHLDDGHTSPIVSLTAIGAESKFHEETQIIPQNIDRKSHSGLAFQLASLEESGRLFIWIVVEVLPDADSGTDLGLAPHGKIKLIRSLTFNIPSPVAGTFPAAQFRTTCVQFSVIDPNHFYVGTDTGHIIHCTQHSASTEQSVGSANNKDVLFNELELVSPVSSFDINQFQLFGASLLLAGHDDGSLRLYLSDRKFPVISWPFSTGGARIVKVQWSSIRPSVFFVMDSNHCLHIWDLAIMHADPIKTETSSSKRMRNFSLSKTSSVTSPEIALIFEDKAKDKSVLEVHKLAPHFTQVTDYQELDQLTFLVQSLL